MQRRIKQLAEYYFQRVVEERRHFHRYPELSGDEKNTANFICNILDELHIPYKNQIAGNGVVALLKGALKGDGTVAIRADMDALPIDELSDHTYRSNIPHVMHACGHDVHVASLLGTLYILNDLRGSFGGTVKAIFQPSEEAYDGGAPFMIDEGVLENPEVNVIFGQHVTPGIETGSIGIREGAFMASTDEIYLNILGKGGHAALIDETINPINVGMVIIEQLQQFVKHHQPPHIPTVLSFGQFIANGLTNLIPDEAKIAGTLRTFDENWRKQMIATIEKMAVDIAASERASCKVVIKKGYPVLFNDPTTTRRVRSYAEKYLGKEHVIELTHRMTAEDFAYFLQLRPGTFYRLGTSNKAKGIDYSLHSNRFDIDEEALKTGMGLLSWITYCELNKEK